MTLFATQRLVKAVRSKVKLAMAQTKVQCQKSERVTFRAFTAAMQLLHDRAKEVVKARRTITRRNGQWTNELGEQIDASRLPSEILCFAVDDKAYLWCHSDDEIAEVDRQADAFEMPPAPEPIAFDDLFARLAYPDDSTEDQRDLLDATRAWVEGQLLVLHERQRAIPVEYVLACGAAVATHYARRGIDVDLATWTPDLSSTPAELRALNSRPDV